MFLAKLAQAYYDLAMPPSGELAHRRLALDLAFRDYLDCRRRISLEERLHGIGSYAPPSPSRFCWVCPVLDRCDAGLTCIHNLDHPGHGGPHEPIV